jgi:hypothetical protein
VEPFVKLIKVREFVHWESFYLLQHVWLIPLLELREFMLWSYTWVSKHLKLLCEHLKLEIHIVMNFNFFQKIWTKGGITNKKVLTKC